MSETPKNRVLTPSTPAGTPDADPGQAASTEYPKALYHKTDSKPGALVSKLVTSAEEEKEAGDDWVPFQSLKLEDADA